MESCEDRYSGQTAVVISTDSSVICRTGEDEDPFADIDADQGLSSLVSQISDGPTYSAEDYVNGDNDLPVCEEFDGDNWDEQFLSNLTNSTCSTTEDVDESDDEQFDSEPPCSNIKNYQEALSMLEDVQLFLDPKGHSGEATKIGSLMDTVVSLRYESLASTRQATLDKFF